MPGKRILIRTDGAGFSHAFCGHLVEQGLEYLVGFAVTDGVRAPSSGSRPGRDPGGRRRRRMADGADIAVARLLDLTGWPTRMRVMVRRAEAVRRARPAPPAL